MTVPHSRPTLDDADVRAVVEVLRSHQIAQGQKVREFEEALAAYIGVRAGAAVSSGTAALHLALLALNVGRGHQVILPSYVCPALLNAVNAVGAEPVLADVNPRTFNLAADSVAERVTSATRAIVVPHHFGQAADMAAMTQFGVPVVEDCAQAVGSRWEGRPVGALGTVSVFSFYATKVMTTGEGGMVLSNFVDIIDRVRDLRDYDRAETYRPRFNYKMTDFQAALGLTQLSKLPGFLQRRKSIAETYHEAFAGLPVELPRPVPPADHIYYRYVIKVDNHLDRLLAASHAEGVDCQKPVFKPLHYYLRLAGHPNTERVYRQALSVPIYPGLRDEGVDYVARQMRTTLARFGN